MPAGPYPPLIVAHTPRNGQDTPLDTEITVQFDQPMDRDSVAQAFRLSPIVDGDLVWRDSTTLVFRPKALAAMTRYRVSVGMDARSIEGLSLAAELTFAFSTVAPLQVTQVNPADTALDVRADAPVLIAFNRAISPVNCAGQAAQADCPALPLKFSPAVLGSGVWLNPSLYRFEPLSGWTAGVTYQITLEAGVRSVDGAALATPYTWAFNTALPVIQEISPTFGQKNVSLDAGVRVAFNTPMDPVNTVGVFSIKATDGTIVSGTVTWADGGALLLFTPTQKLRLDTRYTVRVGERARAITSAPLQNPQRWGFETVPAPAVRAITPAAGAKGIPVDAPVQLAFAGAIAPETVAQNIQIAPEPDSAAIYGYFDRATNTYQLSWDKAPRTEYCITLVPGVLDVYGNALGATDPTCFTTGDLPARIDPVNELDMLTLDAANTAQFYFRVRNLKQADFVLSELDEAAFVGARHGSETPLREWTETFATPTNEETLAPVTLTRRGTTLPTGYYVLRWTAPLWGERRLHLAVVDRHLLLKLAPEEALVWVTDLRSGAPISRTAVRLVDREGVLLAAGTTNNEGLAQIPLSPRSDLWQNVAAIVGTPGAPGFGLAITAWQASATPWAFDLAVDYGPFTPFTTFLYTDRSTYRPGQSVQFRGIVRAGDVTAYQLPKANMPLGVLLRDPRGNRVYSETLTLSQWGSFAGKVLLPDNAVLGTHTLLVTTPGVAYPLQTLTFTVAAYRAPEFEVAVKPEFAEILQGEVARGLVQAVYRSGSPVANASLHWTVRATPYPAAASVSQVVASPSATTDVQGKFLIELPTSLPVASGSQRWSFVATLTDARGLSVSGAGEMVVHAAGVYLGIEPERRVVPSGSRAVFAVRAWDWAGAPLSGQKASVTLLSRTWVPLASPASFSEADWVYTDTVLSTLDVTMAEDGQAQAEFRPAKGGVYVARVEAVDTDGHLTQAETLLWVSGDTVIQGPSAQDRVTPVADRAHYQAEDTARILLPLPFEGSYRVLMTVERDKILHVAQFTFETPNPIIELTVPAAYAPNVVVSFVAIRAVDDLHPVPDVRVGYIHLPVAAPQSQLNVTVTPDRQSPYTPGESVVFTVRTTDAGGAPVAAEIGLMAVDAGARRSARAVPQIWGTFYGARGLQMATGDSLLVLFDRGMLALEPLTADAELLVAKRLDAGAGVGATPDASEIPAVFPDTLLWETQLQTDASGEVQVSWTLPDSLTPWEIRAYAVTADTQVGQAQMTVPVARLLSVRPETSRFMVPGDRPQVAAVVYNHSAQNLDVMVTLNAEEAVVESAPAQSVAIPAGGQARVAWQLSVPQTASGAVSLLFSAQSGAYTDTARPTVDGVQGIPLYRYVTPETDGIRGTLTESGTRLATLLIPEGAGPATSLEMRVDHSPVSALLDGQAYLDRYPYETTDALLNHFSPHLAVYQALQALDIASPDSATQWRAIAPVMLERLYARQNLDGGWGWWQGESDLVLTAEVVMGFARARANGFTIHPEALDQALIFLKDALPTDMQSAAPPARYILVLYAMAEAGYAWPSGTAGALYTVRDDLDVVGKAYLTLALGRIDPADPRLATLLTALRAAALISPGGAHWEIAASSPYWETDTQATAVALTALARFAPDDPLLPQAVRWLLRAREDAHWATPYETSWALVALAEAAQATGDWQADYAWGAALNGSHLTATVIGPAPAPAWTLSARISGGAGLPVLQPGTPAVVEISRTVGSGQLYYATSLALSWPADKVPAESRGMTVRREYCAVDGAPTGMPTLCRPVQQVYVGDLLEVRLTLTLPQVRHFVMLADRYPAGFAPLAVIQTALPVTPVSLTSSMTPTLTGAWRDPFEHYELTDEQAIFFARALLAGTYQVIYRLRAVLPGVYQTMPATARAVYFPELWGRSEGGVLGVLPAQGD